jgi:hypothetical protein
MQIFCFLFPSSSLGTQVCRSSSFDSREAVTHPLVPKLELGNEGESFAGREAGASRAGRSQAGAWERGEKSPSPLMGEGWGEGEKINVCQSVTFPSP